MKNIILANKQLNDWCGTEGINYYEGIEALGFLFKYAVPKLRGKADVLLSIAPNDDIAKRTGLWHCDILMDKVYIGEANDPAPALLWALDKVREASK